jgi:hypothetical protein
VLERIFALNLKVKWSLFLRPLLLEKSIYCGLVLVPTHFILSHIPLDSLPASGVSCLPAPGKIDLLD